MKKSLLGLMLGITFLFGNIQEASALTGMELKTLCANNIQRLPCLRYVQGVVYGFQLGSMTGSDGDLNAEKKGVCFPKKNTSTGQWVAIVKKYLEDHPEDLHMNAASTILLSLRKAFPPCYVEPDYGKGRRNK